MGGRTVTEGGWFQTALRRAVVWRGLKVALVVGTILTAINQGDAVVSGKLSGGVLAGIALPFLVPCCVSTFASVQSLPRCVTWRVVAGPPSLAGLRGAGCRPRSTFHKARFFIVEIAPFRHV